MKLNLKTATDAILTGEIVPGGVIFRKGAEGEGAVEITAKTVVTVVRKLAERIACLEARAREGAAELKKLREAAATPAPAESDANPPPPVDSDRTPEYPETVFLSYQVSPKRWEFVSVRVSEDGRVRVPFNGHAVALSLCPDHTVERHGVVGFREIAAWSLLSGDDAIDRAKRLAVR